eukprot:37128-Eustigmatos_ZCMA.PRE.1
MGLHKGRLYEECTQARTRVCALTVLEDAERIRDELAIAPLVSLCYTRSHITDMHTKCFGQ